MIIRRQPGSTPPQIKIWFFFVACFPLTLTPVSKQHFSICTDYTLLPPVPFYCFAAVGKGMRLRQGKWPIYFVPDFRNMIIALWSDVKNFWHIQLYFQCPFQYRAEQAIYWFIVNHVLSLMFQSLISCNCWPGAYLSWLWAWGGVHPGLSGHIDTLKQPFSLAP